MCTCEKPAPKTSSKKKRELASNILKNIRKALSDETVTCNSVEHLFTSIGINQEVFEAAYTCFARKTHVHDSRNEKAA